MAGIHYSQKVKIILQLSDLFLLNLAFIVSSYITTSSASFLPKGQTVIFLIIINLFWSILADNSDLYQISRNIHVIKKIYTSAIIITVNFLAVSLILKMSVIFACNPLQIIIFYILFYLLILTGKVFLTNGLKLFRKLGLNTRSIAILGGGSLGTEIRSNVLTDYSFDFKYLGIFDDDPGKCQFKSEVLGSLVDFKNYALQNRVDEVFIALPDYDVSKVTELMRFCDEHTIRVKVVPDFMRFNFSNAQPDYYGNIPIIRLREEPLESFGNRILKRGVDVIISLGVILLVLSWLIPLLGILIKLHSRGPVFFTQRRTGLNNREFDIIKFRSMKLNSQANQLQAKKGDPRIFKLGALIRKYNIDEIPQFINILLGNMSLVGPRPHMIEHTIYYSKIIDSYLVRHFVKPGLTGWAQVNGYRGDTTEPGLMEGRVKHDVYYIENWTPLLDIRIFFKTIYNMFKGEPNAV
jgi:putative colanic acid biosysnthesis UDP-glucose lipid carrier transferase